MLDVLRRGLAGTLLTLLVASAPASARPQQQPLPVLDVPFISQSEALCGGAAAAMVLRYWGERGLDAESFAHLVDRSAAGIRTDALLTELEGRGWNATGIEGSPELLTRELADGRPVVALIEDRPGTFHYVVVVAHTPGAIVFHDPARAPFRVMLQNEFRRRWRAADRWMAVIVPGDRSPSRPAEAPSADAGATVGITPCEQLVSEGIRLAQANDLAGAERALGAALACPGGDALRELAGVRLLQRRWPEVTELASAAVAADPADAYAWRLLATSRFVQNEPHAALEAWNEVNEPRLDLVVVNGLTRSRQRPVERLIGARPGDLLTPQLFDLAGRRLAELPAAASARLEYVPVPGGLAELRATVLEHRLVPSGWWSLAGLGLEAGARREVDVAVGSPSGGGERLDLAWRFWPNRPRVSGALQAPAPFGGVWGIGLSWERQPFDRTLPPAERLSARVSAANWWWPSMRLELRAGLDRWDGAPAFGHMGTELRLVSTDRLVEAELDLSTWAGPSAFSAAAVNVEVRSSRTRRGRLFLARAGAAALTSDAPVDLWPGGDTGHVRPILLRAHPLLDDGALRVNRVGRRIAYGTGEVQQWWAGPAGLAVGAALFSDVAGVGRRVEAGGRADVDAGAGARLAIPGVGGTFRVDVARGLRDGATVVSFAYEP